MSFADLLRSSPFIVPAVFGCIILLLRRRSPRDANPLPPMYALLGSIGTAISAWLVWPEAGAEPLFGGTLRLDDFGLYLALGAGFCCGMTVLVSGDYMKRRDRNHNEYYALLLFALSGMVMMSMSVQFLALLLGLEIMSLAFYVLCGFLRDDTRSIEAAIKYYLAGSFATGLLLFGMALVYGATGSLDFADVGRVLREPDANPLLLLGGAFMVAAFAFKIAAVPFHMWLPDVYEGAPTVITGYMATGVKIAAFGALIRVFAELYQEAGSSLRDTLWWVAVVTMTVGNIAAIAQSSVKRMLAYSAIAHAGYMLIGLVAMTGERGETGVVDFAASEGVRGILFYLLAYAVTNIGAFAVVGYLERVETRNLSFGDLSGLSRRNPLLALSLTVFMLSLAGIPGTAGFIGKLIIFRAAVGAQIEGNDESFMTLAILGVLNSLVALVYYLRVPIQCYAAGDERDDAPLISTPRRPAPLTFAVVLTLALTIWLGLGPNLLGVGVESALTLVRSAMTSLR